MPSGYDLLGVVVGSEGMLGVVTEVTVRLLPTPPGARALLIGFPTVEGAGDCVAAIIGAGIIPGGMEMMDRLAIHAAEDFVHAGYPLDVEALLIVELDGCAGRSRSSRRRGRDHRRATWRDDLPRQPVGGGAAAVLGRAQGRLSRPSAASRPIITAWTAPSRARESAEVLLRMKQMEERYGLRFANVFHAGDGNLHPLILYDANKPGELERAEEFGSDILRLCVEVGGVLTGEHGVGVEKRDLMGTMFNEMRSQPAAAAEMRLRRRKPAQSGQGVSAALPLRRARPHACPCGANCASPTCRASEQSQPHDGSSARRMRRGSAKPSPGRLAAARPLEIVAGGSKRALGRPAQAEHALDVSRLAGVVDYEPAELVLTARPARRWPRSRRCSPAKRQMLAFEPPDWRGLLGDRTASRRWAAPSPATCPVRAASRPAPRATIFLGFSAVNGRGETFQGRRQGGEERHRLRHVQAASPAPSARWRC